MEQYQTDQRQTVDFGVDLGTTNSAIARATAGGIKIIKNRLQGDITPSAVARTRAGQTLVGQDALNKPDLSPITRFKRLMGTANRSLLTDGSEWLPEELSAEVLKDLKASVQRRFDVQPTHVVITVPAMFQQPQCEATHRAAGMAGLTAVLLLQEPIAAATAYLNDDAEEGHYLIYDLGGGTFDVSVVRVRDNEMSVVSHGGDNYLGGSDFDQRVFDWVTGQLERRHGKIAELQQSASKFLLLRSCEEARKLLSDDDEAVIDLGDLGLPTAQVTLTRAILEDLIGDIVGRTIRLARERLVEAEMAPKDIRRILLVGGPTMTPLVRRALKEELGISLSLDQDPMTVVATGAAITASAMLVQDRSQGRFSITAAQSGSAVLELHYDPISPDTACTVSGRVVEPTGFTGEVRLTRTNGDWDSGWLPLRGGAFQCELNLKRRSATAFQISLRDLVGTLMDVSPASLTIRHGLAAAVPVTPYDYGVVLNDGAFDVIIKRNQPLPAVGSAYHLQAAKTIPAGSAEELHVYFLEGESRVAADNMQVGHLVIQGRDLSRTLREGEKIEIRIHMDESRRLKAKVSIPLLDLDFELEMSSIIEKPPTDDLRASLVESAASVQRITALVAPEDEQQLRQSQRDMEQVEAELERVSEEGAAERVMQKLMPIKANMRELEVKYGLHIVYREAVEMIDQAERIAAHFNDHLGLATTEDLRQEADRFQRLDDEAGLKAVHERAEKLFWHHYLQTRECWIGYVEWLRGERRFASEAIAFDEYLKRAEDCLLREDFEGVRLNGSQAASYLPEASVAEGRFKNSGIRR